MFSALAKHIIGYAIRHRVGYTMKIKTLTLSCSALLISSALLSCAEQEYSSCEPLQEQLQILFKPQIIGHPFSHSFCVVCNPDLDPEEIQSWATEMGATSTSSQPETPCLYAYADREEFPEGFETLAQCASAVCEGGASYNDIVSRDQGNINLDPILGPSAGEDEE
jgi:hypothetical protein